MIVVESRLSDGWHIDKGAGKKYGEVIGQTVSFSSASYLSYLNNFR